MSVHADRHGAATVIGIDFPPVNALSISGGVVAALHAAVDAAIADAACAAIVVTGRGRLFCAGADINDFDGDPVRLGALRTLRAAIEASPKPVVAALHGMALGGGLELAMACHYRVAAAGTRLGLPEIKLGLLPGGGGTQRLPRLAGAKAALEMMLSGKPIGAERAATLGLVDEVTAGDPVAAAIAFAAGRPARPTAALPAPADLDEAVAAARAAPRPRGRSQAPAFIVDCVAASATAEGMRVEAERFAELMVSEPSRGLRHAFFGERMVARIPGLARDVKPEGIERVAIIGGGTMGTGIAIAILNAGLAVTLIEPRDDGRAKAEATIRATIRRDAEKGRITPEAAGARLGRLTLAAEIDAAAGADLAIEAVFEDMAVKEQVFAALERVMPPHAILASNTSTLDLDAIARFTKRPERVVGLHFFSPANIMRLLEIVRGAATAPEVLASAMAFAGRIGKVGVVSGVCDGFIGNRIVEELLRQAYQLIEEGALPQRVDGAMEAWGMAMGPFRVMDLAGQDIGWSIRKRRAAEQPDRPYSGFPDRICELGRFGQKTGRGIYLYADGRTATVDPEVEEMLLAYSAGKGIARRAVTDGEIVDRCVLAMVNEGAKIVGEGIAYRPVDVDIVYLYGYGFPAERGGPMFYADRGGLPDVLRKIEGFAAGREGWAWAPAPLLVDLVARGADFASLNR